MNLSADLPEPSDASRAPNEESRERMKDNVRREIAAALEYALAFAYTGIDPLLLEDGGTPDITRGTLEGQLMPGPITMFRLQSTPGCELRSYIAEGEMLDIDPCTFGGIGVAAVPEFARFYRHVLIGRNFPHHGAFGFKKVGKILFEVVKLLGVENVGTPLPRTTPYPGENPFELFKW